MRGASLSLSLSLSISLSLFAFRQFFIRYNFIDKCKRRNTILSFLAETRRNSINVKVW